MSRPTEPSKEHPSTYVVQDRGNQEEMDRLSIQDEMLTASMGGVLPEQDTPTSLRRVLDVGCGTGGWLIETARTYPQIETLVGGDISTKMLTYARTQAEAQALDGRVQFKTMDALRRLEFPTATFDLVNHRLGTSWLRTWEWNDLFVEYLRVTRPGGIIRITEGGVWNTSNSPALTRLGTLVLEACYHSGRLFRESYDGLTSDLADLMTQHAIQEVQTQVYSLVYRAGTPEGRSFYENLDIWLRVGKPFFEKWTNVPGNYDEICQQAREEMLAPDFVATSPLLTAWGIRPKDGQPILRRGLL